MKMKPIVIASLFAALAGQGVSAPGGNRKARQARSEAINLLAEGQTLEQQGDRQQAFLKFQQSAQLAPSPAAYYHLGRLARVSGDKANAQAYLNQALALNPSFELAKVELINLNQGNKKDSKLVKTMAGEMQGEIRPGTTEDLIGKQGVMNVDTLRREVITQQSLAKSDKPIETPKPFVDKGRPEPAAPNAGKDVLFDNSLPSLSGDGSPDADRINAVAFGEDSKSEKGSKAYHQETELALGTYAFHRDKGDSYRESKRYPEAAVEYETALKIDPENVETRTLLAEMYALVGKSEEAEEQFTVAKEKAPEDSRIYYKQGNAYFDDEKYDLAIGSYLKALEINPKDKFVLNNLGVVYMEKKEFSKAVERFKQVLEVDPEYEMAVLNLGIIYDENLVDKPKALEYYDKYIKLNGPRKAEVERWAGAIRKDKDQAE